MMITKYEIEIRVKQLAYEISFDHKDKDKPIYLLFIGDGAFIFAADLVRELSYLKVKLIIGSITVKTYKGTNNIIPIEGTVIRSDLAFTLKDKHVLIVEDILDTGNTLNMIWQVIKSEQPSIIDICVLVRKKKKRIFNPKISYIGFEIEDKFIVGYGMDFNNRYRELPYIKSW